MIKFPDGQCKVRHAAIGLSLSMYDKAFPNSFLSELARQLHWMDLKMCKDLTRAIYVAGYNNLLVGDRGQVSYSTSFALRDDDLRGLRSGLKGELGSLSTTRDLNLLLGFIVSLYNDAMLSAITGAASTHLGAVGKFVDGLNTADGVRKAIEGICKEMKTTDAVRDFCNILAGKQVYEVAV